MTWVGGRIEVLDYFRVIYEDGKNGFCEYLEF